ncbi:MAG: Gfo/Idh/MocA family oxidoreductase [Armatimonadetes bacterium]|nr:Gfo/Idh/MocA family oxidoreductase [Armatimonadota bacterium]
MTSFGVGLIGCGGMAMHLAREARELPQARIVSVCDVDEERAAKAGEEFGASNVTDYRAVLENPEVEAVIIATPGGFHEEPTVAAAQAGKHVYCEKPMAVTLEACDRMEAACRDAGVKLMIGQVLRLYPTFHKTADLLREKVVGEIQSMHVVRTGGPSTFSGGWRARYDLSGGLLMEVNAHELDFMRHVAGDVESVYATSRQIIPGRYDYDDTFQIDMTFRSGATGHLYASCASTLGEYGMTFECSEGTLQNGGFGGPIRYAKFGEKEPTALGKEEWEKEEPYRHELRLFFEAVEGDTETAIPAREGRAAVELALAAYRSAETGEVVRLPLEGMTG